jgi:hypothetical protein
MQAQSDPLRDVWLQAADLACLLHVTPKTISRWTREGRLANIRQVTTIGEHRRYHGRDTLVLVNEQNVNPLTASELLDWHQRQQMRRRRRG